MHHIYIHCELHLYTHHKHIPNLNLINLQTPKTVFGRLRRDTHVEMDDTDSILPSIL